MSGRGLLLMRGRITRCRVVWLVCRWVVKVSVLVRLVRLVVGRWVRRMRRMSLVLVRISVIMIGRRMCRRGRVIRVIVRLRRNTMRM